MRKMNEWGNQFPLQPVAYNLDKALFFGDHLLNCIYCGNLPKCS